MRYEINVSVDGNHLFATVPRSCTTYGEAVTVFNLLREQLAWGKMPSGSPRYMVTLTEIREESREIARSVSK